jgi:hypothetical protein
MKLDEWINIPSNPIQRDTQRHALFATNRHLKETSVTHREVSMAMVNGEKYKLDGHTRAYLIGSGDLKPDYKTVHVTCYECQNTGQVKELYKQFDNQLASEKARDRLFGAYRSCDFHPKSGLIINGPIPSALQCLGRSWSGTNAAKFLNPYLAIPVIKPQLELLDTFNFGIRNGFTTGIMAAAIATLIKEDPEPAMDFWRRFGNDEGNKTKQFRDAVQCLRDYVTSPDVRIAGGSGVTRTANKAIACYQKDSEGITLLREPKPVNLKEYINFPLYVKGMLNG